MGRLYKSFSDGEKIDFSWRRDDYKFCCCDCGLVHKIQFAVKGPNMRMRVWRDNRATGQIRRKMYGGDDGD